MPDDHDPTKTGARISFEPGTSLLHPNMRQPSAETRALLESFNGEPILVDVDRQQQVLANLIALGGNIGYREVMASPQPEMNDDGFWFADDDWRAAYRPYKVRGGVLHIPVKGTLVQGMGFQFGNYATGHQYIEAAVKRGAADPEVRAIMLDIDSPGGHAAGNFEVSDLIYETRSKKPIRAAVLGAAYSGGYSIASAAEAISVSRSGGTGSVGVVTMHIDLSGLLNDAGIKVTMIYAGKHKVDGHPFAPLPEGVQARIQGRIDKLYGTFVGTVARNRSMSEDAVRKTEALTYDAEESVEIGFADKIETPEEAAAAMTVAASTSEDDDMADKNQGAAAAAPTEDTAAMAEAARVEGAAEARAAERQRTKEVMASEHYAGREALASTLLDTEMSSAQIIDALSKAPAPKAASGFIDHMNREGGPNVGAGQGGGSGDSPADPVDQIMTDFRAHGGTGFGRDGGFVKDTVGLA